MLFLSSPCKADPVTLDQLVDTDSLNYSKWVVDAINAEVARHKARRLDKYSRFIFDVDKLQEITGLRREKHAANKQMWSVWY